MAEPPQSPVTPPATTITDLDEDSMVNCATYLSLRDVCNLAMASPALKRLAYSDSIWQRFFSEQWHQQFPSHWSGNGAREVYLARYAALRQFKFFDPFLLEFSEQAKPCNHLLLCENSLFFSQGSLVKMMDLDGYLKGTTDFFHTLSDHKARITCMRLFSLNEATSLFRGKTLGEEQSVLVTSSCDHSIRLWWKGSSLRCFRGHNGPVLSLSNKLLGEDSSKVLASGGEDGTVRLWSLSSSGGRGQRALKATLYGHEKPVNIMSIAGHKTSLLATISRDSKVRVWDTATATSSAVRASCCVGMTSVPGTPVNMKCHESLLYVAAGSSVTAVDLRTMQKVVTAAIHQPKLCSFDAVPSKYLICTGGDGRAMLWDIRRNQESLKPEPIAELDGHCGPVTLLYMDSHKIVTGGPKNADVNVWDVDTGVQTNSLPCSSTDGAGSGCDAMAVEGCRITTASSFEDYSVVCFRDFNNATNPVAKQENELTSKFWDSISDDD
ncbi:mitochondrial division protein 1-like [Vigna umbellata]|uniref:mitochondrial division protein 1-like n=1 Tax=Vigna umbellata TaxID=87088 RepID=UPI001F5E97CC|nr:mitochondrial division protein 1-like [Vigna umbellata]